MAYLDEVGLEYFWDRIRDYLDHTTEGLPNLIDKAIGGVYTSTKTLPDRVDDIEENAVVNIEREPGRLVFVATKFNGETFTFDQRDKDSVTGVKGAAESVYHTDQVSLSASDVGALPLTGGTMSGELKFNSDSAVPDSGTAMDFSVIGVKAVEVNSWAVRTKTSENFRKWLINDLYSDPGDNTGIWPVVIGGTGLDVNPEMKINLASSNAAPVFQSNPAPGVSGTLSIGNGGTGLTASPSLQVNLASQSAVKIFSANPKPGVTGVLSIANGGTGKSNAAAAWTALGGGSVGKKNSLEVSDIPALPASKVTSGTFSIDRIPKLTLAKIPSIPISNVSGQEFTSKVTSSLVSCPNDTYKTILSVTIGKGVYVVHGNIWFAAKSGGARWGYVTTNSKRDRNDDYYHASSDTLVTENRESSINICRIISIETPSGPGYATTFTVNLIAWQDSGSAVNTRGMLEVIKIADTTY